MGETPRTLLGGGNFSQGLVEGTMARTLAELLHDSNSDNQFDVIARWHLWHDDADARVISGRLEKVWRRWPVERRELLLKTAERIAAAEQAKLDWNPKADGVKRRYTQIAIKGLQAARLAKGIAELFPPPWGKDQAQIRNLVAELGDFAVSCLRESAVVDRDVAILVAERLLQELHSSRLSQRVSRVLIADLAWLASGKIHEPLNESTIRRYSGTGKPTLSPAARYWKKDLRLILEVARLVPSDARMHGFDATIRGSLGKTRRPAK